MKLRLRRQRGVIVFDLSGEAHGSDGHTLRTAFERAFESRERGVPPKILVNLEGMTRMDSATLGALVYAHSRVSEEKGKMCLTGVSSSLRELLTLSRLDTLFSQSPDETTALAYLES